MSRAILLITLLLTAREPPSRDECFRCFQTMVPCCAADAQKKKDKHGFVNMRKAGPLQVSTWLVAL